MYKKYVSYEKHMFFSLHIYLFITIDRGREFRDFNQHSKYYRNKFRYMSVIQFSEQGKPKKKTKSTLLKCEKLIRNINGSHNQNRTLYISSSADKWFALKLAWTLNYLIKFKFNTIKFNQMKSFGSQIRWALTFSKLLNESLVNKHFVQFLNL